MKKLFAAVSVFAFLFVLSQGSTFASQNDSDSSMIGKLSENPIPLEVEVKTFSESVENELVEGIFIDPAVFDDLDSGNLAEITPFANFPVTASNLKPGYHTKSSSYYYVTKGVDKLDYGVSWSPTGNNILIGFVSRTDSSKQYAITIKSGIANGTLGTSNVPSGDYYVYIGNPSSNSSNINGSGTFSWK